MRNLTNKKIPKIEDFRTFEHLCKEIIETNQSFEQVQFNGSSGQSQDGVDIIARIKGTKNWIGIQCKVRDKKLSVKDIITELNKAKDFNPKLTKYEIYTTANRDSKIQGLIREKFDWLGEEYGVDVKIVFWDDIVDILRDEEYFHIYHRYYKEFFANNETLGHGISKLITLELGIGNSSDTYYELMIGKTPTEKSGDYSGINYYKGCYFIINLNERKMETFPIPCFPSDLEQCFLGRFDRFRICNWINSIKNIDDFIYSKKSSYHSYISKKKYIRYINEIKEE